MTLEMERLPTESFMRSPELAAEYQDVHGLYGLYDKLAFTNGLMLVGPKGIGKSLSVAAYAAKNKIPQIAFDCSEDVRRSHLLGGFVLRGGDTPFVLGPVTTAFEVANEVGSCILTLEEANTLTPQMQKVLNGILDFRCRVEVPEAKKVFQLNPGAKLWVVGTMNFAGYGGVYELNEDLKSRLNMLPMTYPSTGDERVVLEAYNTRVSLGLNKTTLNGLLTLAHETRQQAMEYALSTRDLTQLMQNIAALGADKALWLMSGKFEGEDRTAFRQRVSSVFGIEIAA